MKITGTIMNYYFHCKRQCWLFTNRMNLEDNSEDVHIGRVLHEIKNEGKKNTEIAIDCVKIDKITEEYLIEIKKSDADLKAVKWQVLLYLKKLKEKGIHRKGKIEVIEKNKQDKKIHFINLEEKEENQLDKLLSEIENLVSKEKPPKSEFTPKCKRCAYYEYCYI